MARLEDLKKDAVVKGILTDSPVTVIDVKWYGSTAEVTYKDSNGNLGQELLYRDSEPRLEVVESGRVWSFDGDGKMLRLASEAYRIHLAYLFDPLLAVHTSRIDPLPHQITAVYEEMLTRQPLRFLLADDPGAGKTIMTGLLIKELMVRGDLERCLIVCPGNLVEQWQDEMKFRFHLDFWPLTRELIESTVSGNPFVDHPLMIARLDQLKNDDDLKAKLERSDWDLIVCDEAHKMSASYFGGEVKETKRYKLGKLLSTVCRHYLLLTATPHNGRDEDFQLFMALLDGDRFEGKPRQGTHSDVRDMMRRLAKEEMKTFDGKPLFPQRIATSVNYKLSDGEIRLYQEVTEYVSEGMNLAQRLSEAGHKRRGNSVGFALQILQRRLASSPAAIHESLKRRLVKLESRLREEEALQRGAEVSRDITSSLQSERATAPSSEIRSIREESIRYLSDEDLEDLDEAPETEVEKIEQELADTATAALNLEDLRKEINQLRGLARLAGEVRQAGTDRKWEELRGLLHNSRQVLDSNNQVRKLIVFTEHRDTLNYLRDKITDLIGRPESVVVVYGSLAREERRNAQEAFMQDPAVRILVATDAAGEGVNLQRAHLMVNYDLPWNPNRIEQRFGRIHRIGQREVCHLWNLIAEETREGDVFKRLFEKLNQEREALGGHVFDVLGQVFTEHRLRDLLIEAIRYGDRPEVRAQLEQKVDDAFDHERLTELIEERALVKDSMDISKVMQVREELERAEARRLQPHFIREFFLEAFGHLGGSIHEREKGRYEITHVPSLVRSRDRQIGVGAALLRRYERITFEKETISVDGKPLAEFVCPGHPLLDVVIDLIRERYGQLLRQGALLVDQSDSGTDLRALFYIEHSVQDGRPTKDGGRRVVSKRLHFVELDAAGHERSSGYAPYLDYRPARDDERDAVAGLVSDEWLSADLETMALGYAVEHLVRDHLDEVKNRREQLTTTVEAEVKKRLLSEINYWDKRYSDLRQLEQTGRQPGMNSMRAREIADELQVRLQRRMEELKQERNVSSLPPIVVGGALVVPFGLLKEVGLVEVAPGGDAVSAEARKRVELLAMEAVMEAERKLGREPRDVSAEKVGYDIESAVPGAGRLVFIEVKGREPDADTVLVTKNEILTALNKPDDFVLALVAVDGQASEPKYLRRPFENEPDFEATSVNYRLPLLLERAGRPC